MQKAALTRPDAWLSLLGSALALVAFFLPYYSAPTVSLLQTGSLGDCLDACTLDLLFESSSTPFGPVPWGARILLLLLLCISALALLALFLRPPQWKSRHIYLHLTALTLIWYLGVALLTFFSSWVGITIASTPTDDPNKETLSLVNIGAWLIPLGLLLASS